MYNVNLLIDFIQSSKKQFVNATATNDIIRLGLINYVDKQTEFCKTITENFVVFSKEMSFAMLPKTSKE